jgi:hypothetical protein
MLHLWVLPVALCIFLTLAEIDARLRALFMEGGPGIFIYRTVTILLLAALLAAVHVVDATYTTRTDMSLL